MLLDTIKRHDDSNQIKLLSIEALKASHKLPSTIHSVPALMLLPDKTLMFGKNVFDYLLLPGSGKLLARKATTPDPLQNKQPQSTNDQGPSAFVLGANLSDNFSPFAGNDEHHDFSNTHLNDRVYNWTSVNDTGSNTPSSEVSLQEDTRVKKSLPDIDFIRQQRDMDMRGEVNVNSMPPPTATRTIS